MPIFLRIRKIVKRGSFGIGLAVLSWVVLTSGFGERIACAQGPKSIQPVWLDTDIGDDIDDAFALGLILRSPELKVVGISTAFGDTELRARLVDRYLKAVGVSGVPVTAGVHVGKNFTTQGAYARQFPARVHADGVDALLEAIRANPGEITVIAIGPLSNIGAAIDRDVATFRKLKRVVMMGGSVDRGYDGEHGELRPADPEWNILCDPKSAQKLFASGVPIFMMPLDSTQIHFENPMRDEVFGKGTPGSDQVTLLYHEWIASSPNHTPTPVLYDPVAAAYSFRPDLCPTTEMRIEVDDKGFTRKVTGKPNAEVCLKSDEKGFLGLLVKSLESDGN